MHAVTMKWESLRNSLQTYIQSLEQFDSTARKNLNQNLFIILLLKITIIHWLMHAVTMKWESLHKKNYFWRFNFLVGAKSTFYSSSECYVHCWNIIYYTVFQWNVLALKWIEYFSVRVTHGITREVELFILLSTDLGLNPLKRAVKICWWFDCSHSYQRDVIDKHSLILS